MVQTLVSKEWLHDHLENEDVVVVDCRSILGKPEAGWEAYQMGHIPNARFADLERDLSSSVQTHGGRHPLPDSAVFIRWLTKLRISPQTTVVAYDEKGDMAPHFWWLLRYFGHDKVSVLIGGITDWQNASYPIERASEASEAIADWQASVNQQVAGDVYRPHPEMTVSRSELLEVIARPAPDIHLVDARAEPRYRGEIEPIDPVAGHIPTAQCYPWEDTVALCAAADPHIVFQEYFAAVRDGKEIVVYCGSGVSACVDILALYVAGIEAKLYPGSWSDWCSYPDSPIARA